MVDAKYVGTWELPVLGDVSAPTAVLIRPDGCVAWVGELTDVGLRDALTTADNEDTVSTLAGAIQTIMTRVNPVAPATPALTPAPKPKK